MKDKVVKRLSQSGCTNIISLVFINFWNALMRIIIFYLYQTISCGFICGILISIHRFLRNLL